LGISEFAAIEAGQTRLSAESFNSCVVEDYISVKGPKPLVTSGNSDELTSNQSLEASEIEMLRFTTANAEKRNRKGGNTK
jgi:hypothetical protein